MKDRPEGASAWEYQISGLLIRIANALETQKSESARAQASRPVAPSGPDEERVKILVHALERIVDPCDEDHVVDIAQTSLDAYRLRKLPSHASDCAIHNAPALEPAPCDCGVLPAVDVPEEGRDPADWTPWHGGECPCPGAWVHVRTKSGKEIRLNRRAARYDWGRNIYPPGDDITHYRIVTPVSQPETSKGEDHVQRRLDQPATSQPTDRKEGDAQSTCPAYDEAPGEQSSGAVEWPDEAAVERAAIALWQCFNSIPSDVWPRLANTLRSMWKERALAVLLAGAHPPIPHDGRDKKPSEATEWPERIWLWPFDPKTMGNGMFCPGKPYEGAPEYVRAAAAPHDWREKMKAELDQAVRKATFGDYFILSSLQSKIAEWEKEG